MTTKLTIGLIIYNGVDCVRKCIDSLLSQTYSDFKLLIHDNCSIDGTSEVCAEYAKIDARIKHVRHPETIPQSENFRGILMAANTQYFMWAADDDVWGKDFAKLCIEELEQHPEAVACCTKVEIIRPDGSVNLSRGTYPIIGKPEDRIAKYIANPQDSSRLYGVYRTEFLQKSYPEGVNMYGYDWLIVALTCLYGDHLEVDKVELVRSGHMPGKYFEKYDRHFVREKNITGKMSWFFPLLPLSIAFKNNTSPTVYKKCIPGLLRINLIQSLSLLKWKFPALGFVFDFSRNIEKFIKKE